MFGLVKSTEPEMDECEDGDIGTCENEDELCREIVPNDEYPRIRLSVVTWFVTIACFVAIGSTYAMSISFGRFAGDRTVLQSSNHSNTMYIFFHLSSLL